MFDPCDSLHNNLYYEESDRFRPVYYFFFICFKIDLAHLLAKTGSMSAVAGYTRV